MNTNFNESVISLDVSNLDNFFHIHNKSILSSVVSAYEYLIDTQSDEPIKIIRLRLIGGDDGEYITSINFYTSLNDIYSNIDTIMEHSIIYEEYEISDRVKKIKERLNI